jgi:hypothetical protein
MKGCDASILLDGPNTEKTAPENSGIFGYDFIDDVKTALERVCPGVVSCADIIIAATRDAVGMVSHPAPFVCYICYDRAANKQQCCRLIFVLRNRNACHMMIDFICSLPYDDLFLVFAKSSRQLLQSLIIHYYYREPTSHALLILLLFY